MRFHGLAWLLITIVIFLFGPLMTPPDTYVGTIDRELQDSARWYAGSEVDRIANNGERVYAFLMVDSGMDPALKKYMMRGTPSRDIAPNTRLPDHMARWADRFVDYWAALLCNIHLFCFRLAHAAVWFGYLLPFLGAIVFDGLMTRKAKIESFKYTSPTVYNVSWHLMIAIVCFSIVYFALSAPISVFFYPVAITTFGLCSRALIGNIQHSA